MVICNEEVGRVRKGEGDGEGIEEESLFCHNN